MVNIEKYVGLINKLRANIGKVIIGKEQVIDLIITSLISEGHILLEDLPGTGKTILAKSLAKSISSDFSRIQFTPDLLPSDVTGLNYYNQKTHEFTFKKGPIFTNILLADEINRATPRTQSALLESMEEKQVTIDGETRILNKPFFVIATQNPIETAGTFQLPEAQMDRFLMKLSMGSPSLEEEILIMNKHLKINPLTELESVTTIDDILELQNAFKEVYIHNDLIKYIAEIVTGSRNHPEISMGISPRGSLAMIKAARAYALIKRRAYVIPEDIKDLIYPIFQHRIVLPQGILSTEKTEDIIQSLIDNTHLPTEDWSI